MVHEALIGNAAGLSLVLGNFFFFLNKDMYFLRLLKAKLGRQK